MKKICTGSCGEEKDLSDFRRDSGRPDGRQSSCKICTRDRIKSAYTLKYKDKTRVRDTKNRNKNTALILEYKLLHPCERCGEKTPVCLDFHHTDPSTKKFSVGQNTQYSWSKIKEEIDKCIVLCANCHRKLHAEENNALET